MTVRWLPFSGAGVCVALLVFLVMQAMIRPGDLSRATSQERVAIDFTRMVQPEATKTKDRSRPEEPPPPDRPPPPPSMEVPVDAPVPPARLQMDIPQLDLPLGVGGGPYLGGVAAAPQLSMDEEVIPVVQIPPQYPRQALRARLEGHVTMEFTIEPDGSVSGIQVIEAEPPRVFNAAAVTALSRWKFKPRMVDGRAVARPARQTISFNLE